MNLPERSGGEGNFLYRDEPVEELASELALDDAAYVDESFCWDFVLKSCQLLAISSGKTSTRDERNWPTLMSTPPIFDGRASGSLRRFDVGGPIACVLPGSAARSWEEPFPSDELERHGQKKRTIRRYRCEGVTRRLDSTAPEPHLRKVRLLP